MCLLQRLYNAIMASRERKHAKLRELLYEAVPYYDQDYDGDWDIEKLVERILEITDGKK